LIEVGYGVKCHFQQYFSYIVAVSLMEEAAVHGENHRIYHIMLYQVHLI
jgi:hypothetical protein